MVNSFQENVGLPLLALNSTTKSKSLCVSCLPSGVDQLLVLHYRGLRQQMPKKPNLQIICTYRLSSCSGHVSEALGTTKEHIKQLLKCEKYYPETSG